MAAPKTPEFRKEMNDLMLSWRGWRTFHKNVYLIIGGLSSAIATFVAANSKQEIISPDHAWIPATIAAILTFVITALGAQSESKAFETGARLLEAALIKFDSDPDFGDLELGNAATAALSALNRKS